MAEAGALESQDSPSTLTVRRLLLASFVAIMGGALSTGGALVEEVRAGGVLVIFIGAPIIEESLKPGGVYVLLARWHWARWRQRQIVFLCALAGLTFGIIESAVYVWVYAPDESSAFVYFRFGLTAPLHALFSAVLGLGLGRSLIEWGAGKARFPRSFRRSYLAAVCLHAAYNTAAVVLSLVGVVEFE